MKILTFLIGAVLGGAFMLIKDNFLGNGTNGKKQQEMDDLFAENEKMRKRNKELERQVEDLLADNQKRNRDQKNKNENLEDLEDSLEKAHLEIKKLRRQKEELSIKSQEYKAACENYEIQIANFKK